MSMRILSINMHPKNTEIINENNTTMCCNTGNSYRLSVK